jgi:hypothetical protein
MIYYIIELKKVLQVYSIKLNLFNNINNQNIKKKNYLINNK